MNYSTSARVLDGYHASDLPPLMRLPRVAIICDFVEENWLSMDLIVEMKNLGDHHASPIQAVWVRPQMTRPFTSLPVLAKNRFAYNADRLLNRFWS
jgi:hypothetical protein